MDYYLGKLNAITRVLIKGKQKHQSQRRGDVKRGEVIKRDEPRITKAQEKLERHQKMDSPLEKGNVVLQIHFILMASKTIK